MTAIALPTDPAYFASGDWTKIAPWFDRLAEAQLDDRSALEWLGEWSTLEELVGEAGTLAMIAYTCDTRDGEKERRYLRFSADVFPKLDEQHVRLSKRLLDLGYERDDLEVLLREFRTDAQIFREENVPRFAELEEHSAAYQKITGGLTVEWNGETKTVPQLQPFLKSRDRDVREKAFRLGAEAYAVHRDDFATLFDRMYTLRQDAASAAGFANYEEYVFHEKHRFDYTPADCRRFHEAVEKSVVPAVQRLLKYRRDRLGIETVRPWDLLVDPSEHAPLVPFANAREFVERAEAVFRRVDAELGDQFRVMADDGLLDLENRMGKAPGGYCTRLTYRRKPFIFMNAVGVPDDVNTLLHEAGHCFHAFLAASQPFTWQRGTGSEAAELASMSMELLAAPYLARPDGFYETDDARRAMLEHLEDLLLSLPHIASVDAFQSWVYTSGEGGDRDRRDAAWLDIRARFEKGVDWSGLERERVSRWYRQLHIFEYPFYYIEYGIAQFGALQVWRASLDDQRGAVERYKQALTLGRTRSLPEIFQAAGARLVFDAEPMAQLVELVENKIEELRG